MEITTRPATLGDLDILLDLEQAIISDLRPFDLTLRSEKIYYYNIGQLIESPETEMLIAESGNEIIGCGYARIDESKPYLKHSRNAYFGFMYVKPAYRGQGVNKTVMAVLQKWAVSKGITELRLEAYYANLPAITAYEKLGFVKHMSEMRMELPTSN